MSHSSLRLETVGFNNIIIFFFFYTLSSAIAQSQEWPSGTLATGSSIHPPLDGFSLGQFTPDKAIDKDSTTKWNDDTIDEYPDIFTLNIGSVVNLDGITLLSGSDGWILNYTVDTSLDGASWNLAATVELSNTVLRFIRFDKGPLKVKQLRINITAAQNEYSRIMELLPVYAAAASISATDTRVSSTSTAKATTAAVTTTPISNTPSPATAGAKSNTAEIVAGVLGGLAAILLGALAYFLWLLRKQRNSVLGTGVEGMGQGVAVLDGSLKNTVSPISYHSNVASEIGGQHPQEAGGYPRIELP